MKLTQWFGDVKPVHVGVYERRLKFTTTVFYSRWDGEKWWRIDPADAVPDPVSAAWLASDDAPPTAHLLATLLAELAERPACTAHRCLQLRFCTSPRAFRLAEDGQTLCGVEVVRNRLVPAPERPRPVATEQTEVLEAQLALTSIGYRGVPLPGVPFDEAYGVIPSVDGRVRPGEYVTGWARRGPTGLIGANRPDARQVVDSLLADLPDLPRPSADPTAIDAMLAERGVRVVSLADWERLDAEEVRRGVAHGRIREKMTDVAEMLRFLDGGG